MSQRIIYDNEQSISHAITQMIGEPHGVRVAERADIRGLDVCVIFSEHHVYFEDTLWPGVVVASWVESFVNEAMIELQNHIEESNGDTNQTNPRSSLAPLLRNQGERRA